MLASGSALRARCTANTFRKLPLENNKNRKRERGGKGGVKNHTFRDSNVARLQPHAVPGVCKVWAQGGFRGSICADARGTHIISA